jgi:hypothetical protein
MLVSYFTGMKISNPNKIESFKRSLNVNNARTYEESVVTNILTFTFVVILILISIVPAITIAVNCNRGKLRTALVTVFAFFLSDIYLCNYAIRRYWLKEPGYCK